jgi:NAD(P)-dependent dehydrogenase (short-subunit alcohol dehydrogenase family)
MSKHALESTSEVLRLELRRFGAAVSVIQPRVPRVALPRLFERIPDLRLAVSEEDLEFVQNSIVYGSTHDP